MILNYVRINQTRYKFFLGEAEFYIDLKDGSADMWMRDPDQIINLAADLYEGLTSETKSMKAVAERENP